MGNRERSEVADGRAMDYVPARPLKSVNATVLGWAQLQYLSLVN